MLHETPSFSTFALCLSQACLDKTIIFSSKRLKRRRFSHHSLGVFVIESGEKRSLRHLVHILERSDGAPPAVNRPFAIEEMLVGTLSWDLAPIGRAEQSIMRVRRQAGSGGSERS
jgi:hypothetical protein